jgi:hypothetical protein
MEILVEKPSLRRMLSVGDSVWFFCLQQHMNFLLMIFWGHGLQHHTKTGNGFTTRQMASSTNKPSRFGTAMSPLLNTPPAIAHFNQFPWWPNHLHSSSAQRLGLIT